MKPYHWSSGYRLLAAFVLSAGMMPLSVQAASSYLQDLKDEAQKVGTPEAKQNSTPADTTPTITTQSINPTGKIKAGLSKEEFENQLQQNYYGSYLFYATLLQAQQEKVYEEYQQKNDIESIRESIMSKLKK